MGSAVDFALEKYRAPEVLGQVRAGLLSPSGTWLGRTCSLRLQWKESKVIKSPNSPTLISAPPVLGFPFPHFSSMAAKTHYMVII